MRDFCRRTLFWAAVGFVAGVLVGLAFLAIGGIQSYYMRVGPGRTLAYMALSGLLGAVNVGTTTIYSLERWGVLRCTLVHFAIAMTSFCAVGFTLGWLSPRDPASLWMLTACVVAYFIIWLIMYLRYKLEIRRINEALKGWKDAQRDE